MGVGDSHNFPISPSQFPFYLSEISSIKVNTDVSISQPIKGINRNFYAFIKWLAVIVKKPRRLKEHIATNDEF